MKITPENESRRVSLDAFCSDLIQRHRLSPPHFRVLDAPEAHFASLHVHARGSVVTLDYPNRTHTPFTRTNEYHVDDFDAIGAIRDFSRFGNLEEEWCRPRAFYAQFHAPLRRERWVFPRLGDTPSRWFAGDQLVRGGGCE